MSRRLLAPLLAAVVLLLSAGCTDEVTPALRVGDRTVSHDTFLAEVGEWTGNPMAVDPSMLAGPAPGAYPGDLVRQLVNQRIDFELHAAAFEAEGLTLTADHRDRALILLFGDPTVADQAFAGFSEGFAASFVDDIARQVALEEALGADGYGEWRTRAYADTRIEVSARYGTWDPQAERVVPPPAPRRP